MLLSYEQTERQRQIGPVALPLGNGEGVDFQAARGAANTSLWGPATCLDA